MATRTKQQGSNITVWLVGITILMLIAAYIALCVDTKDSNAGYRLRHADIKHGNDAQMARDWIANHGQNCRWECSDGIEKYACAMTDSDGKQLNKWAVLVRKAGKELTAFVTGDQGYIHGMMKGCSNSMQYSH